MVAVCGCRRSCDVLLEKDNNVLPPIGLIVGIIGPFGVAVAVVVVVCCCGGLFEVSIGAPTDNDEKYW